MSGYTISKNGVIACKSLDDLPAKKILSDILDEMMIDEEVKIEIWREP